MVNNQASNKIGDFGIPYLHAFPQLTSLSLWNCSLSSLGVKELSKLEFVPHLQRLQLRRIFNYSEYNQIGDEGVRHLEKFASLTYLELGTCGISGKGVEWLSEMEFPELQTLGLSTTI